MYLTGRNGVLCLADTFFSFEANLYVAFVIVFVKIRRTAYALFCAEIKEATSVFGNEHILYSVSALAFRKKYLLYDRLRNKLKVFVFDGIKIRSHCFYSAFDTVCLLCLQMPLSGHSLHLGALAEHISRPKSTIRWQKSDCSDGSIIAASIFSIL